MSTPEQRYFLPLDLLTMVVYSYVQQGMCQILYPSLLLDMLVGYLQVILHSFVCIPTFIYKKGNV